MVCLIRSWLSMINLGVHVLFALFFPAIGLSIELMLRESPPLPEFFSKCVEYIKINILLLVFLLIFVVVLYFIGGKPWERVGGLIQRFMNQSKIFEKTAPIILITIPYWFVMVVTNFITKHHEVLFDGFSMCLLFVILVSLGVFAYWIRLRFPLLYGCIEISIGAIMVWKYLELGLHRSGAPIGILDVFPVAAGIYIIVRGLDNISKKLPKWIEPYWAKLFGENPDSNSKP